MEGWIAGLQLAALSMQGHTSRDVASFIKSFTGSHHFVLDYLVEEVLQQQTESVQTFLLRTSILDRMCGPLCDTVVLDPAVSGQATLEYLERANLFIVPLDHERHWYRYHHLFAELLRQRLQQSHNVAELHVRASQWYENNDLLLEAFHHAAAANDVERAVRLMESKGMPLHLPGAATTILNWLESLPTTVLNARPELWWKQASLLLTLGQTAGVEEKLQATEAVLAAAALPDAELDDQTRNLIGEIAVARASLALAQHQAETIHVQARRALEYLHPNNLPYRSEALQAIGYAYYLQGDRAAAGRAYAEALALAQASGNMINTLLATTCLGQIQQLEKEGRVRQLTSVYARQNGIVSALNIRQGMYVTPEMELMTLADPSTVWLKAEVFEQQASWLAVGQKAEVRLPQMPGEVWEGAVEYIYPDVDAKTRAVRARLRFANPGERLKFCLLYTSPSPRDGLLSRMPSSA